MLSVKLKFLILLLCIFETIGLLTAQVLGAELLLWIVLIAFFLLILYVTKKDFSLPVLLFFLPFSPLLKLQPGTMSLFTIAFLVVYIICFFKSGKRKFIVHFFPVIVLLLLALIVKTVYGYEIDNRFVFFFMSLFLIPYIIEGNIEDDFVWGTVLFSLGIIIAAISAQYLTMFPTIRRYITVHDIAGIVRRSGYYGDPNFFNSHITAALSGTLVVLLTAKENIKMFLSVIIGALLIYCGFLSVSKSFAVILVFLALFAVVAFMVKKDKISFKLTIIVAAILCTVFLLSSTVFIDNVDNMLQRLNAGNGFDDFTTGRLTIWNNYFIAFDENPLLLLFGKGMTDVLFVERPSHNTIIQCLYQFGIVGSVILIAWFAVVIWYMLDRVKYEWRMIISTVILLIGCIGPWMALDFLFFNEFFLTPAYMCIGIRFMSINNKKEGIVHNK